MSDYVDNYDFLSELLDNEHSALAYALTEEDDIGFGSRNRGKSEAEKPREFASIPGHLCAPIYGGEVDLLLSHDENSLLCERHKLIYPKVKDCISFRDFIDPIGAIQDWVTKTVDVSRVSEREDAILAACRNWVIQKLAASTPAEKLVNQEAVKSWCDDICVKIATKLPSLRPDLTNMMRVEKVKDKICFKNIFLGDFTLFQGNSFERDLSVIKTQGKSFLFPTNLVLCGLDKLQSLFGLKLYWLISDIFDNYPGFSMLETGTELYKKFLDLRRLKTEGFFSFAAAWEPLVVGYVVNKQDDLGCSKLYNTQASEMTSFLLSAGSNLTVSDFLPKGETENETRMYLELIGMVKIVGYPVLMEEKLLDQLREHGTESAKFNLDTQDRVDAINRRNFTMRYFKVRNQYPKLLFCPKEITKFVRKNTLIPSNLQRDLSIWGKVIFDKNFDFDFGADLSDRIKDSACALNYSSWGQAFDKCSFKHLYGKKPPPSSFVPPCRQRRVIDSFLKADPDIIRKIFHDRERGIFDVEDHVIFQCGKELEQKEKSGRAFTKQTEYQRYFQVSLEHEVAEKILPFVPEQSMTDSEVQIANKHMQHIKNLGGSSQLINFDLQKWCLRHRVGNVRRIGKMYDELFGLNGIYENSHDFFLYVPTFCNSRFSPPDYDNMGNPIPGPYFMDNFIGGCEGMHQKKWTHSSVGILNLALEACHLKGTIMCQGDNIIVILHFDAEQTKEADKLRSTFLNTATDYFADMNHKLKDQETWYSKHLHEYGKQRIYKGVAVSSGTKKATKIIPDINDGLSSFHSCISTLNTTTESIARASTNADTAFILNQMIVSNFLIRKKFINDRDHEGLRALLLCPADFGGLPLSNYFSHSVRGHDDHITSWLCILQMCKKTFPLYYQRMIKMWQTRPESPANNSSDRTRLYEDPYCLNINSLPSAESSIKDLTLKFLQSDYVTNPTVKRLYSAEFSLPYQSVIREVDKMRPMYAQLANALVKNSNAGIGKILQGKLTSSKTVEKAAGKEEPLLDLIDRKNNDMVRATKQLLLRNLSPYNLVVSKQDCPVVIADNLRQMSWGIPLVGLTKSPYQHQVQLMDLDKVPHELRPRTIVIKLSDQVQENPKYCHQSFGPFKPYVGSRTKERITRPSIDVQEKTSYVRAVQALGKLKSWLQLTGAVGLVTLCDKLIDEKLDVIKLPEEIEVTDICPKIRGGNMYHRLSNAVEHSIAMVNCLLTVTSHYSQSSNLLQSITQDGEDYTIFFQLVYASNIYLLSSISSISNEFPPEIGCVLTCTTCTKLLPETNFDIERPGSIMGSPAVNSQDAVAKTVAGNFDLAELLEQVIGMELAKNIDENYSINHSGADSYKGTGLVKKSQVSINDFRKCSLNSVFCYSFAFSAHCQQLTFEDNELLLSNSNDLSFSYVAELMIESDRREELFAIMGKPVPEHTMVTRSDRMSAYISRGIKRFVTSNYNTIVQKLSVTFREDIHNWRTKNTLLALIGIGGKYKLGWRNWQEARRAMKRGNIYICKKTLGVEHIVPPITKDEVVSLWRVNRESHKPPFVCPNQIEVDSMIDISLLHYQSFLNTRIQPFELIYDYSFLSFIARPIVVISSAANKYIEILISVGYIHRLRTTKKMTVCLAEGSAGTDYTLSLLSQGESAYNTLMKPSIDLRDCATDFKGPACVVGGLDENKHPDKHFLSSGETNILKDGFLSKLSELLESKPPFLVTMDAESMNHGTNIEFVGKVMPVVLRSDPDIVIFKMFYIDELSRLIEKTMNSYTGRCWILFKPFSSNPTGREIFLVVMRKSEFENNHNKSRLMSIHNNLVRLKESSLSKLSRQALDSYIQSAMYIKGRINLYFKGCPPSFGDRVVVSGACSYCCVIQYKELCEAIDRVHFATGDSVVNIVIRAGGTNFKLSTFIMDMFFMHLTLSSPDLTLVDILEVCNILDYDGDCVKEFRRLTSEKPNFRSVVKSNLLTINITNGGNFLKKWNDVKFFMRNWRKERCSCTDAKVFFTSIKQMRTSLSYNMALYFDSFIGGEGFLTKRLFHLKLSDS